MPDLPPIKAGYFFLAFMLLWFPGCTPEPVETDLLLFVDYSNVPENMVLTDFHTDKIEIKIKGHPQLIEMINTESIRYPVDMYTDLEFDPAGDSDSIEPGAYMIPVEEARIPVDPAIRIVSIKPSYLTVRLDMKVSRALKVVVPYTGDPAKGYIALEAATDPPHVEVTGSAEQLQSMTELKTKPIDISGARESFRKEVPLAIKDVSLISLSKPIIKVSVPIQQKLVSKRIPSLPIEVRNTDRTVRIEPDTISIVVKGPYDTIENPQILEQIHSFIDLEATAPGIYVRHAVIHVPVQLVMTDAEPQVFTIKIE